MNKFIISGCIMLSGCAAIPPEKASPHDPWESFNRKVFEFNQTADQWVIKPVASAYAKLMPLELRKSIANFFSNLDDLKVLANDILQLKLKQASDTSGRVLLNTTVGFFGFFDPASEFGVRKREQDFGQTLGVWGFDSGPYVVLPLLGASTLRDGIGIVADLQVKKLPFDQINHDLTQKQVYYGSYGLNLLNLRAELLGTEKLLDTAATDPYVFMRNAYLQKRQALINNDTAKKPTITDQELFD